MDNLRTLYGHLRTCFRMIIDEVLGEDYYTIDMSVVGSDEEALMAILGAIRRLKSTLKWSLIFNSILSVILALVFVHLIF